MHNCSLVSLLHWRSSDLAVPKGRTNTVISAPQKSSTGILTLCHSDSLHYHHHLLHGRLWKDSFLSLWKESCDCALFLTQCSPWLKDASTSNSFSNEGAQIPKLWNFQHSDMLVCVSWGKSYLSHCGKNMIFKQHWRKWILKPANKISTIFNHLKSQ